MLSIGVLVKQIHIHKTESTAVERLWYSMVYAKYSIHYFSVLISKDQSCLQLLANNCELENFENSSIRIVKIIMNINLICRPENRLSDQYYYLDKNRRLVYITMLKTQESQSHKFL